MDRCWKTYLVRELDLRVQVANALIRQGLTTVPEVLQLRDTELLRIDNFGRKALNELNLALEAIGAPTARVVESARVSVKAIDNLIEGLERRLHMARRSREREQAIIDAANDVAA